MVRLESNRARKGDADFRAPTPTPGHGLPKAPKPKKPRAPRAGAASRPSGSFEQQHPRGSGAQGGQWIKKQGGAGAPIRQAVQRGLGVQGRSAVERSSLAATIKSFQRRHGLQVDGVVGEQTGLALAGRVRLARSTRPGEMSKATARLVRARHQPRGGSSRSGRRRPVAAARRAGGGRRGGRRGLRRSACLSGRVSRSSPRRAPRSTRSRVTSTCPGRVGLRGTRRRTRRSGTRWIGAPGAGSRRASGGRGA
jgi:hypothetical protein